MSVPTKSISQRMRICQDVFRECRERVSCAEVARFYGFTPNRAGFICCPFHNEKTASLKLYRESWYCFGCKTGGDVVDFAARLHGLSMLDAAKRLNDDFGLGLEFESTRTPTAAELKAARERRETDRILSYNLQRFESWRRTILDRLNDCLFAANFALRHKSPAEWTNEETLAIKLYPQLEFYADSLDDDRSEWANKNQLFIFTEKEGIEALCNAILH